MKTIVTHNAKFHSDDVFAVASLFLLLGEENCAVTRTRDPEHIAAADYVVDAGDVFDPVKNRFDHHQSGGAGKRMNGIDYASFGLVWKTYGEKIAGSKEVAEKIDQHLVQLIDAADNGQNVISSLIPEVFPFTINGVIDLYRSTWKEEENWDERFLQAVHLAKWVIERQIKMVADTFEGAKVIETEYKKSADKRVIIIGEEYDFGREVVMNVLVKFPEPIYALLYRSDTKSWQVLAIRKDSASFESRKALPEAWRAKRDKEFETVSGVPGAAFCHRSGFMCLVATKEGALALAEKALDA